MANGRARTLDEFGWNSSQTATTQRTNTQAAFNSGEPIRLPAGETVTVDGTLSVNYPMSITGNSDDMNNLGTASSRILCSDPSAHVLLIQADNVSLTGFDVSGGHAQRRANGACGIIVGNGTTYARYATLERVSTNIYNRSGVKAQSYGSLTLNTCHLWGGTSALWADNVLSADAGDNTVVGTVFNASYDDGYCFELNSGGGWYVYGGKFGTAYHHLHMDWNRGGSGGLSFNGVFFETCKHVSLWMRGSYQFQRADFVGCSIATPLPALCVLGESQWLDRLLFASNNVASWSPNPILDIDATTRAFIHGNSIDGGDGGGTAGVGIYLRSGVTNSVIGHNFIIRCALKYFNGGSGNTIDTQYG